MVVLHVEGAQKEVNKVQKACKRVIKDAKESANVHK
jgi:hypothetical protein